MKHQKTLLVCLCVAVGFAMTSCDNNPTTLPADADTTRTSAEQEQNPCLTAIENYLTTNTASSYAPAEISIPCYTVVATQDGDTADIRVWGDWWVFNYNVAADTLKTVSGGNHPGVFHIKKTGTEYTVTAFEQVEDGAGFMPSAKRIFGNYLDLYQTTASNNTLRDSVRTAAIAHYAKKNRLKISLYQDFGRPAVALPKE